MAQCVVCGRSFIPRNVNGLACSPACRQERHRATDSRRQKGTIRVPRDPMRVAGKTSPGCALSGQGGSLAPAGLSPPPRRVETADAADDAFRKLGAVVECIFRELPFVEAAIVHRSGEVRILRAGPSVAAGQPESLGQDGLAGFLSRRPQ